MALLQHNAGPSAADVILISSLSYLCYDLLDTLDQFSGCSRPVHVWLIVSYAMVIVSRMTYAAGMQPSASAGRSGSFLLDLRHRDTKLQSLVSMFWVIIMPSFVAWTVLGTFWCMDVWMNTPGCLVEGAHFYFLIIWQVLSFIWISVHVCLGGLALNMELSIRRAEGDLRLIESDDVRLRWGEVSRLEGYRAITSSVPSQGMRPAQIQELPCHTATEAAEEDCPICISGICAGDSCRRLPQCGHVFHRGCIDLWLLRAPQCPLCKGRVHTGFTI